jgi:hypothetical protein
MRPFYPDTWCKIIASGWTRCQDECLRASNEGDVKKRGVITQSSCTPYFRSFKPSRCSLVLALFLVLHSICVDRYAVRFTTSPCCSLLQSSEPSFAFKNAMFSLHPWLLRSSFRWSFLACPLRGCTTQPICQAAILWTGATTSMVSSPLVLRRRSAIVNHRCTNRPRCGWTSFHYYTDRTMVNLHVSPRSYKSSSNYQRTPCHRIHSIHKRAENKLVSTFRGELIGLSILWIFWLVGAAIASVCHASCRVHGLILTTVPTVCSQFGETCPSATNTMPADSSPYWSPSLGSAGSSSRSFSSWTCCSVSQIRP